MTEVTAGAVTVDLVNNGEDTTNLIVFNLDDGITVQDMMDEFVTEPRTSLSPPLGSTDPPHHSPTDVPHYRGRITPGSGRFPRSMASGVPSLSQSLRSVSTSEASSFAALSTRRTSQRTINHA